MPDKPGRVVGQVRAPTGPQGHRPHCTRGEVSIPAFPMADRSGTYSSKDMTFHEATEVSS